MKSSKLPPGSWAAGKRKRAASGVAAAAGRLLNEQISEEEQLLIILAYFLRPGAAGVRPYSILSAVILTNDFVLSEHSCGNVAWMLPI